MKILAVLCAFVAFGEDAESHNNVVVFDHSECGFPFILERVLICDLSINKEPRVPVCKILPVFPGLVGYYGSGGCSLWRPRAGDRTPANAGSKECLRQRTGTR